MLAAASRQSISKPGAYDRQSIGHALASVATMKEGPPFEKSSGGLFHLPNCQPGEERFNPPGWQAPRGGSGASKGSQRTFLPPARRVRVITARADRWRERKRSTSSGVARLKMPA